MKGPIVVRELRSPADFAATVEVSRAAWRYEDVMVSPPTDLIAATHSGGLTAGAYRGKRLVAFVHGVPRTNLPVPCQHSHLLAVHPDAQGLGLAAELKLFQRRWCLERGIGLVTWTYDPFLLKNARLNMVRLRAAAEVFLPNFYGEMGGIYGNLPSDRFEIRWRLDDPTVERAARSGNGGPPPFDGADLPVATPRRVPSAARVAVPFPADGLDSFRAEPAAGRRARRDFATAVSTLFDRGYRAVWVVTLPVGGPAYVFARP